MDDTRHSELDEDFLRRPSLVNDVVSFLTDMANSSKPDKKKEPIDISLEVTDTNFWVDQRGQYQSLKRKKDTAKKTDFRSNLNQMTFMRQIDVSQEERSKVRQERKYVADNYRRLGNGEFRRTNYDKAIEFYTKGLDYISDSPVLFVNRALCYIKKREFKRGLLDLEHVIYHLDNNCLQAWLYRAGTLKRMNDEPGFQDCVDTLRHYNQKDSAYIDYFLEKMKADF